jgi:hypothetical protein
MDGGEDRRASYRGDERANAAALGTANGNRWQAQNLESRGRKVTALDCEQKGGRSCSALKQGVGVLGSECAWASNMCGLVIFGKHNGSDGRPRTTKYYLQKRHGPSIHSEARCVLGAALSDIWGYGFRGTECAKHGEVVRSET